jgi:hypothetical protein
MLTNCFIYSPGTKFPLKYPDALKDAAWQKKKSWLDKNVKTKTGLGPALVAAATAWDAIDFSKLVFDPKTMGPRGVVNFKKAKTAAEEQVKKVPNAVEKVKKAHELAKACNTNNKLSKDARDAAGVLVTKLNDLVHWLGTIKLTDFDDAIKQVEQQVKDNITAISNAAKDVKTMLVTLAQTPTHAAWIAQTPDVKAKKVFDAAANAHLMGGDTFKSVKEAAEKAYNGAKDANHTILSVYGHKVPNTPLSAESVKRVENHVKEFVKGQATHMKAITGS